MFWSRTLKAILPTMLGATYLFAQQNEETDRASLRRKAQEEWYNENYSDEKAKKGGPWKAQYRKFILDAAAKERQTSAALLPGASSAPVSGSNWVNIRPTGSNFIKNGSTTLTQTDSGRIRNILTHPTNASIIYIATAGGGVWRTTNGGLSWAPITESLGTLSIGWLAMDPANVNTLYLGLGDPFDGTGIGLVKSTDGGTTWSNPVYLGDSTITTQVIVSRSNPQIVMATTNKGLYRSTNGGANWSLVSIATGQAEQPYVWSIAHTGGTNFVIALEALSSAASGTTDGQTWTTTNDGATWTKSTGFTSSLGIGRATVASAPSSPTTVYAMAAVPNSSADDDLAEIFRSTNGGVTWTALGARSKRYSNRNRQSSSVSNLMYGQAWYNQTIVVSPTDPNLVYFGGCLLLAKTTNGGSTFSQISNWLAQYNLPYIHADFHASAFDASGNLFMGTDGGLFKSTNGGTTWTSDLNKGIVTHLLYSACSTLLTTQPILGGMQDNGTRIRAGSTQLFDQIIGGDGFACDAHQTTSNLLLGSLYNSRIQKSTNNGSSFTQACSGITECGTSNAPFYTKIAVAADNNTLFTFANTRVYKSTNYAGSWTALPVTGLPTTSFVIRNIAVAKTNVNNIGIVANGGANWAAAGALPNNGFSLSYIHFDSTNASTIYVASVAPDGASSHLWKSTNGGVSWASIDTGGFPAGIPVNFIRNDPNSSATLYAGTHLGVYRSTDGGSTWARFGSGMPLVNINEIYISADSTRVIAGSYGRGFWQLQ